MIAAAGFVLVVGGPSADESIDKDRADLAEASSGRTNLITGGIDLFQDARSPARARARSRPRTGARWTWCRKPVSHTEPITVAAEQGMIGLIPYFAVIGLSAASLLPPWPSRNNARAGVAAAFAALFVHSLGYAGFAIDPAMWALLALGFALRE